MSILSPQLLSQICEIVAANEGPLKKHATSLGVSEPTLFRWLAESRKNPADYLCEFSGESLPFHVALKRAQLAGVAALRAKAFDMAMHGEQVPLFFQGRQVFQENEEIIASGVTDPDELSLLFGQRDAWLRDENGKRVPAMQRLATNAVILLGALRATDPQFADRSEQVVTYKGGVKVIGQNAQPMPAPAPVHRVEHQPIETVDAEFTEVPAEPHHHAQPIQDQEPEPRPQAQSAPEPQAAPMRGDDRMAHAPGDSPIVRDMKAKFWENRQRVIAAAKSGTPPSDIPPLPPEMKPLPDDDLSDIEGEEVAKPAPMAQEAIDNRVGEVLARRARGEALNAIERQMCKAHDRGDEKYIRSLLGARADDANMAAAKPAPGGFRSA